MSKGKARRMSRVEARLSESANAIVANDNAAPAAAVEAFTFGEPEAVLDRRQILDMLESVHNGRWYEPPVPVDGLARAFKVSPHHSSAIYLKRNLLVSAFEPTPYLSRAAFEALAQDYLVFGNAYVERVDSLAGTPLRLRHAMAKFTRRGLDADVFWWVADLRDPKAWRAGQVLQIAQPDVNQELYGVPEYLSALQSALLNEAATLFRRRYYLNGSHAGFILFATGEIDVADTDAIKDALRKSKGPGNFRNLFVHAPNGKEGSLSIKPIAEVGAKDEFLGIKNVTRDDMLAAHRVPHQLIGIVPAQGSVSGDPSKAVDMFHELEMLPLQCRFLDLNERLGVEAVRFRERATAA